MVIYADILVLVNFIVDYFLIRLTAVILRLRPPLWRTLAASFAAALSSLYIFLPQSPAAVEIAVRAALCAALTLIGFGFKNARYFIRTAALLLLITFGFAGCMAAVWYIFKPAGMTVNNSVVYFNVSPLWLILSSAAFYLAASVIKLFAGRKNSAAVRCSVTLTLGQNSLDAEGIIDTGNSVKDPFSGGAVVLLNREDILKLTAESTDDIKKRYRAIPCKTVSGAALLEGYRLDKMTVSLDGKQTEYKSVTAAISKTRIAENSVILNPDILE